MTALFGYPLDAIARALGWACVALLLLVLAPALRRPVLLRIALRQLPRRRAQMVLVALGLSLGASIITSVFLTGDTVQTAIHLQVVEGLGSVDEILHDQSGPYVPGDVDITNLSGLDTGAPGSINGGVFLDQLSGRLTTEADPQPEVYFPTANYRSIRDGVRGSRTIAALLPEAVEHHALLTDTTSRQIRGQVKVIGLPPRPAAAFGILRDGRGRAVQPARLPSGTAAINAVAAADLGARPGDRLILFLHHRRFRFRLDVVVANGGLAGATPSLLLPLTALQTIAGHPDAIDRILVVNRGTDDAAAAEASDAAASELYTAAPANLAIDKAKARGLRRAEQAQEIFSRIFTLFALFAAGVGLLLVFLIFTILAADRRPEMGIGRVVGLKRRDLVWMYLYEGTAYALIASALGLALGIGIGAGIVGALNLLLSNYGFTIQFVLHGRATAISYALGLLATWVTVVLACWWATRLTITSAIRDLPEPPELSPGPIRALLQPWRHRPSSLPRLIRSALGSLVATAVALCLRGPGLLILGVAMAWFGVEQDATGPFAAGLTLAILGLTLAARALLRLTRSTPLLADRIAFSLGGALLVGYWSLPADAPTRLGLPALHAGIELFFLGGVAMVLGAVWLAMYNLDILVRPLAGALRLPGRTTAAVRTAVAYTLHRPARTGLILAMFGLVSFTLTVMAVVTDALQRTYGDVQAQTGGFDIRGDLLYDAPIGSLPAALRQGADIDPRAFSFAGSQTFQPVGVVQLSAPQPGWRLAYADVLDGDFLRGTGFALQYRAAGYPTDAAVWAALRHRPGVALIGSDLLPGAISPLSSLPAGAGLPALYTANWAGRPGFRPFSIWLADPRGGRSIKLRIIGVADDSDGRHGGVIVPNAALNRGGIPLVLATSYFRVRPGQDATAQARRLGSHFLEHGMQTTVLQNAVWVERGPKILLARLLQGFVGLVLLLGIAGLAATALRSVVERRQQIGMMRALGMPRRVIRLAFVLESSAIALAGLGIGVTLGLLLARNLFLADFFEQYQTGLTMQVPWRELSYVVAFTYLASLAATLIPAHLAGHVPPAEALMDR